MKQYDFEEIINKIMADRILAVIKEEKRIKAIEIAYILGTDRKTINHYLYSELRWFVEKDQNHYWSLKGHRPKRTSDDVFYLTEYIPKRLWRYKREEELEESKLVRRLKEKDAEAVEIVKERMLEAAEDLVELEERVHHLLSLGNYLRGSVIIAKDHKSKVLADSSDILVPSDQCYFLSCIR